MTSEIANKTFAAYLGEDATPEAINGFRDEVSRCIVWGHFYWAVWSLVMIPTDDLASALKFALPYAQHRF